MPKDQSFKLSAESIDIKVIDQPSQDLIDKIKNIWDSASANLRFHHNHTQDFSLTGRQITVNGREVINFGSCSYLGLEMDERLKEGAISCIKRYGTQFSSSITYMALSLYEDLEKKYQKIFNGNVILAPTTTLAHLSCIPLIADKMDAIILDQQVHNSVQMACKVAQASGTSVYTVPHNNMAALEKKINTLAKKHRFIWYMADGVYSMYGDLAPIAQLEALRDKYPQLSLYIDDAHGVSWCGQNGCGYVLSRLRSRERTIVAVSHAKGFGSVGGTLIIENDKLHETVKNFGQTLIFSGPLQPANLGASLASADIHLSSEIAELQQIFSQKLKLRNQFAEQFDLPLVGNGQTPIAFVGVGDSESLGEVFFRLFKDGLYTNCAIFPAVSPNRGGIRFTLTLHHTDDDIYRLMERMSFHLRNVLHEKGRTFEDVRDLFDGKTTMQNGFVISQN